MMTAWATTATNLGRETLNTSAVGPGYFEMMWGQAVEDGAVT